MIVNIWTRKKAPLVGGARDGVTKTDVGWKCRDCQTVADPPLRVQQAR